MTGLWHSYWSAAGGNIVAMPLEFAITTVVAVVFRGPLGRLLGGRAARDAAAARRIAADLHERLTGERHPDAPGRIRASADALDSESEVA